MRIKLLLVFLFVNGFVSMVYGQDKPCYRFTDTLLFDGYVLSVRINGCIGECTTAYCLVNNDEQRITALSAIAAAFSRDTSYRDDSLLLLVSNLNASQFAVMKDYLEDSLPSRFSKEEIVESIIWGIHIEDTTDYRNYEPSPIPMEKKSIGNLYFKGKEHGWNSFSALLPSAEYNDTVRVRGDDFRIELMPFKSWGVIAELNDCDFFGYEVGERLLHDAQYHTIRVFIPLSLKL